MIIKIHQPQGILSTLKAWLLYFIVFLCYLWEAVALKESLSLAKQKVGSFITAFHTMCRIVLRQDTEPYIASKLKIIVWYCKYVLSG